MQEILIANIRTDGGVQSRVAIDPAYVAELAEQVKAGAKLPPVDVYKDATGTWMADGFHRLRAHEAAGKPNIRAEIHKGGQADAAWHSCGANKAHGLRRTNADKQRAVEMALKLKPGNSDRLIAEHVRVADVTVRATRDRCKILAPERTGKDGKTYTVPPPRQPSSVPQPSKPVAAVPVAPVPPPKPEPPAAPVDAVGRDIPDYLLATWRKAESDMGAVLSDLRRLRRLIDGNPQMVEGWQGAVAGVETAASAVKAAIPYAVCPACLAAEPMQAGCKLCGSVGYVGQHRWDTAVPETMKGAK